MRISFTEYQPLLDNQITLDASEIVLEDHLNGFNSTLNNCILDHFVKCSYKNTIHTQYIIDDRLKELYSALDLRFSRDLQYKINFKSLESYKIHPEQSFENFLCSFNGSEHIGRKFLTSILNQRGWFDPRYSSKNIVFTPDEIFGHIKDYTNDKSDFYSKFVIGRNTNEFFSSKHSFGYFRFNHATNICDLQDKITKSFLHIVSETNSTSYYPFVTEKFLYSVVTRGLFLSYAQPRWHEHVEYYYGFKKYTKLFDYRFDLIDNPVERLICLTDMISKFDNLSSDDWRDLYLLEIDTIEYNYDHYFSGDYLKTLANTTS